MKKETKAERQARLERMRAAPARMRELVEQFHRERAEREQRKSQS